MRLIRKLCLGFALLVGITPLVAAVGITISPTTAALNQGATQQFTAPVTGTTNTAVTWTCTGGNVTATGLYTAPATVGTYTVKATSVANTNKSASATVTVTAPAKPVVTLNLTSTKLLAGGMAVFTASVTGSSDTRVTWEVTGGSFFLGAAPNEISYTAGVALGTYTVKATSVADQTCSASACVDIADVLVRSVTVAQQTAGSILPFGDSFITVNVDYLGNGSQAVTWALSGGSITPTGTPGVFSYSAPAGAGNYRLIASSVSDPGVSGSCDISVVYASSAAIYRYQVDQSFPVPGEGVGLTAWFTGTATIDHSVGTVTSGVPKIVHPVVATKYRLNVVVGKTAASDQLWVLPVASKGASTSLVGDMDYREGMAFTELPSGKMLLSGGGQPSSDRLDLFDPATGVVTHIGHMSQSRMNHSAILLTNGNVFITGGITTTPYGDDYSGTWETITPDSGQVLASGEVGRRYRASVILLLDGRVLIAGGWYGFEAGSPISNSSLFDPITQTCTTTGNAPESIYGPATLLADGKVLLGVGTSAIGDPMDVTRSGILYDPATGLYSIKKSANLDPSILHGQSTRLMDGRVLVRNDRSQMVPLDEGSLLESHNVIYDPVAQTTNVIASCPPLTDLKLLSDGRLFGSGDEWTGLDGLPRGFYFDPLLSGFLTTPTNVRLSSMIKVFPRQGKVLLASTPQDGGGQVLDPGLDLYLDAVSVPLKKGYSRSFHALGPLAGSVVWSVRDSNGGTISQDGRYTAPTTKGIFHVVATSTVNTSVKATAEVLVIDTEEQISSAIIQGFSASKTVLVPGESLQLTATFEGGSGSIDNGVGPVQSGIPITVTPVQSTQYTLTVTDPSSIPVRSTLQISVQPVISSFTADRTTIEGGQSVVLTAVFSGGTGTIEGIGSVTSGVPITITPAVTTTYTLNVVEAYGVSIAAPIAIHVTPAITSFAASSSVVLPGAAVTITWTSLGTTSGNLQANGVLVASNTNGNYTTSLNDTTDFTLSLSSPEGGLSQTLRVIASPVISIAINPGTRTMIAGSSNGFARNITIANGYDSSVTWKVNEPNGGTITSSGPYNEQATYTAPGTPGNYTISMTSVADHARSAAALVTVTKPVITLVINPTTATLSCGAKGAFGCSIQTTGSPSSMGISWSATDGSLLSTGEYTTEYTAPALPGTYSVIVHSSADPQVTATATVTVVPVEISITPTSVTLAPGQVIQFGGNIRVQGSGTLDVGWGTSEGLLATVGPLSVRYTAPEYPGTYQVTVTSKLDPNAKATARCTVDPSLSSTFTIIPNILWLPPGGQKTFTAQNNGQVVSDLIWSVDDPSEGTVDANGLYTAPIVPGLYEVRAEDQGQHYVATAKISVGQLSVSPASPQVLPDAQMQFNALAGSAPLTNPTWSILEGSIGGNISPAGLYTAPSAPGVYHILATSDQGAGMTSVVVGLIEAIAFSPAVQIEEAGDYTVAITLEGSNGKQLRQVQRLNLSIGSAQPEIVVSTDLIRREIGVDGPYTMRKIELQHEGADDSTITDTKQDLGTTAAYKIANFQRPWVVFDPNPGVLGLDSNNNGLVDQLKVTLSVDVIAGGNYSLSAVLADMDYKEVSAVTIGSVLLNPGKNQIVLTFDGKAIRARGLEGPYQITGISLMGSVNALGTDVGPINFVLNQFEP